MFVCVLTYYHLQQQTYSSLVYLSRFMGFKNFHLKFKGFRIRQFLIRDIGYQKRGYEYGKRSSWMKQISHGYHLVENKSFLNDLDSDSVVIQRVQIEDNELWFFGVLDARIGDRIAKHMQSNFFDKQPKEPQMGRRGKETMIKAYTDARSIIRASGKEDEAWKVGSASAVIINGEKLVMANMGEYRAVLCIDGEASPISRRYQRASRRRWSRKLIPGIFRMPKVRILACGSGTTVGTKVPRSSEIAAASERIDSDTEFIILASTGIWEVMKHQEAVNLIRHIEEPQEAAECLAREALTRMSRSNICCLIIRFD